MDLEWNGAYSRKAHGYFNEIIDIGAVKLDSDLRELDRFQAVIKPSISRKLSDIVQNLTHIEPEELDRGVTFGQAMSALRAWIGEGEAALLTWSQTDLLVLMEDFRFFYKKQEVPFMTHYADIQRYCQQKMGVPLGQQLGLRSACERLSISTEGMETHRALGDTILTVEVLRAVGDSTSLPEELQPADDIFNERVLFKPYVLRDLDDPLVDRSQMRFVCPDCGRRLRHKTPWAFGGHAFCADLICGSCQKEYRGRVQFKKKYDSVDVKRKLVEKKPPEDEKQEEKDHGAE